MISYISPCRTLGFIPMLKNASTSLSEWFRSGGWVESKTADTSIINFFVMRHPTERLLSGITQCIDWTLESTDVTIPTIKKMMEANQIIVDPHCKSVCEYLYGYKFNPNKLWALALGDKYHTHTMINLLLEHYGIEKINEPFPTLNAKQDYKSQEVIELAKTIMTKQHFHFFLGFNLDLKLFNFVTNTISYYKLNSNYMRQKRNLEINYEQMIDMTKWHTFLQQEILPFTSQTLDRTYFSLP